MDFFKRLWPLFDNSLAWKGWASLLTLSALATTTWRLVLPMAGDGATPTPIPEVEVPVASAMEPFELVSFGRTIDPNSFLPSGESVPSGGTV
jgi:hypothetical protein